jgi:hypothetical protein
VRIEEGKPVAELTLRFERALSIEGRLLGPKGRPTTGTVTVRGTALLREVSLRTADDGTFSVGGLARGTWMLTGRDDGSGASAAPAMVEAGKRDVLLRTGDGLRLVGQVIDAVVGTPLDAELEIRRTQHADAGVMRFDCVGGRFELDGFARGYYYVTATTSDGRTGQSAVKLSGIDDFAEVTVEVR